MSQTTTSTGSLEYNHPAAVYIRQLEQENAKLKAQIENTRLGLKRLEKLISHGDQLRPYANGIQLIESGSVDVCKDSYDTITAPTLADLIDKIALMEVE